MHTSSQDITGGYIDHEFAVEYYDHIFDHLTDMDFYIGIAKKHNQPVLELACGSGRILLPLARSGAEVTGIDLSSNMLDLCRRKMSDEEPAVRNRISLVEDDIRTFTLKDKFPLIFLPYSSFQLLLDVESQIQCLERVRDHLSDDGIFVLSVFNEAPQRLSDDSLYDEFDITPEFEMPDGRKVFRRFRYISRDYTTQIESKESIFYVTHPDGKQERLVHRFDMRYYFKYELIHLLARCGLEVTDTYGGYKLEPYDAGNRDGRMIMVAKKL